MSYTCATDLMASKMAVFFVWKVRVQKTVMVNLTCSKAKTYGLSSVTEFLLATN